MATNKIKGVVLVSFEYPPRRLSLISDIVFKIANLLNKNKIKIWIITFDDWRSDIETIKKNFTVHRIPNNIHNNISNFSAILNLKTAYQSTLASIIHKEQIDIIHFFDWQTLPLLVPWGDKLTQKLIYSTASIQENRDTSIPTNEGIKEVEQLSLNAFDLILADSKKLSNQITEKFTINEQKIIICSFKQKKYASEVLEIYSKLKETN